VIRVAGKLIDYTRAKPLLSFILMEQALLRQRNGLKTLKASNEYTYVT
jgi:hypothetical protein